MSSSALWTGVTSLSNVLSYTSPLHTILTGTAAGTTGTITVTITAPSAVTIASTPGQLALPSFPQGDYTIGIADSFTGATYSDTASVSSNLYPLRPTYLATFNEFLDAAIQSIPTGAQTGVNFFTALGTSANWTTTPALLDTFPTAFSYTSPSYTVPNGTAAGATGTITVSATYNPVISSPTLMTINAGPNGMTLAASSLVNMAPIGATTLAIGPSLPILTGTGWVSNLLGSIPSRTGSIGGYTASISPYINVLYPSKAFNNPISIKSALTAPSGITSGTVLTPGAVIRINGLTWTAPQLGTINNGGVSGFKAAFGIPTPIWGVGSSVNYPWIIIAPTTAPTYAFRHSALPHSLVNSVLIPTLGAVGLVYGNRLSTIGSSATASNSLPASLATAIVTDVASAETALTAIITAESALPFGWADGITTPDCLNSAIIIDPASLTGLAAAIGQARTAGLPAVGIPTTTTLIGNQGSQTYVRARVARYTSASGITQCQLGAGQWNIGVTSCGLGAFTVPSAHIQALLAATGGGQLVVSGGVTLS